MALEDFQWRDEVATADVAQRMLAIATSFPTLQGVLRGWDPDVLDQWACGPVPGSGAFHAARFTLSVWNPEADWRCGRFDMHRALWAWDEHHRAAFAAWVQKPWWP